MRKETVQRAGAVVAVTGLLIAAMWGGDGRPTESVPAAGPPTAAASSTPEVAELPPFTEPADGGEVLLVDSGVSVLVDEDGYEDLAYGFVVQNTSGYVATDTRIEIRLVDESGEVVDVRDELDRVRLLLPGQRFGAGEIVLSSSDLFERAPIGLEVTIGGSLWYPGGSPGVAFPDLAVLGEVLDYVQDCEAYASFTLRSRWSTPADLLVDVTSVIRDGTGTIIGGTGLSVLFDTEVRVSPGITARKERLETMWGCPAPPAGQRNQISLDLYLNPRGIAPAEDEEQ